MNIDNDTSIVTPSVNTCEDGASPSINEVCCPHCHRFFSSFKGLAIHIGKSHPNLPKVDRVSNHITPNHQPFVPSSDRSGNLKLSLQTIGSLLAKLKSSVPLLRRVPRGARSAVSDALSDTIHLIITSNDSDTWIDLFLFPFVVLCVPLRSDKVTNLTSWVKSRVRCWQDLRRDALPLNLTKRDLPARSPLQALNVKQVENKLADGDVRGAVRLLISDDVVAAPDSTTLAALREKHPAQSPPIRLPDAPSALTFSHGTTASELVTSIRSFPSGSAGGLDGLRPLVLKDLFQCQDFESKERLTRSLCNFLDLIISGNVPLEVRPLFFGASLTALKKKCGGIRPIAVGNIWRRIAAKIICFRIREPLKNFLLPHQLGVCVPHGAEAAVHAARIYHSSSHNGPKAFVKLDFHNAFNELHRDTLLTTVKNNFPSIYPYVYQCYSQASDLFLGDVTIPSQRGVQQGDPLGPALFCIALQSIVSSISTEFNVWYLDDGTIADSPDMILSSLATLQTQASSIGLRLNFSKCEVGFLGVLQDESDTLFTKFQTIAPGIRLLTPSTTCLLGAALTPESTCKILVEKTSNLDFFLSRLSLLSAHSAFFLLRASFSIPRLMYFLRCSPSWRETALLEAFDIVLKSGLETILNCSLVTTSWLQATLPVGVGGLGIRRAVDVAIPSFLASFHGSRRVVEALLPSGFDLDPDATIQECTSKWSSSTNVDLPAPDKRGFQSSWDAPIVDSLLAALQVSTVCSEDKARLLAVSCATSGAWLHALPSPPLGLHLSNECFRIATALRLGASVCEPHHCPACGASVNERGLHGLSCVKSAGRHSRHSAINDIILRALISAEVPSIREPSGCCRSDGKRPDGMTLVPWSRGKSLLWDFSCVDTFAKSNLHLSSVTTGGAAVRRAGDKRRKYIELLDKYIFIPVIIETSGSWDIDGLRFIKEVGKRISGLSGDPRATSFLIQRISITLQRGNVSSILGTLPRGKELDEIFLL